MTRSAARFTVAAALLWYSAYAGSWGAGARSRWKLTEPPIQLEAAILLGILEE